MPAHVPNMTDTTARYRVCIFGPGASEQRWPPAMPYFCAKTLDPTVHMNNRLAKVRPLRHPHQRRLYDKFCHRGQCTSPAHALAARPALLALRGRGDEAAPRHDVRRGLVAKPRQAIICPFCAWNSCSVRTPESRSVARRSSVSTSRAVIGCGRASRDTPPEKISRFVSTRSRM